MPPMVNRRGNASRFPTTTSTTPSETPSTPVQIQEATKMLMTHEEIKTALLEGKILYRNKKNDVRVEYKAQDGKFLRREIVPGLIPGAWHRTDISTMSRYEWSIIEKQEETEMKQEETEMKQEEPTTDVIRQVPLGDGTTTVITEKVPVSEAPVVIDPFANFKEDLQAIKKRADEVKSMNTYERFDSCEVSGTRALEAIMAFENKYAIDISTGSGRAYRYSREYGAVEFGYVYWADDKWDLDIDLNDFLRTKFRIVTNPLSWLEAIKKVSETKGSSAVSLSNGVRIVNNNGTLTIEGSGISQLNRDCYWIMEE